jgi:NAD(P)-dependent dehydrogenase (short-subunit alcohol dehydrogenase family)
VFRCNVFGLLNVTRAVLPRLRSQRAGHIVNMSSAGSYRAGAGWGIYCAVKAAVEAISESLSMEGEPLGIYTTVVESSYVRRNAVSARPLVSTLHRIDDYRGTVGPTRTFAAGSDGPHPGAPDTLADAILSLVVAPNPPRRLPLGSAVFRSIERQLPAMPELEHWGSLVLPIDFVN